MQLCEVTDVLIKLVLEAFHNVYIRVYQIITLYTLNILQFYQLYLSKAGKKGTTALYFVLAVCYCRLNEHMKFSKLTLIYVNNFSQMLICLCKHIILQISNMWTISVENIVY